MHAYFDQLKARCACFSSKINVALLNENFHLGALLWSASGLFLR